MTNLLFLCDCNSPDHQLIVSYDKDDLDDFPVVFVHVHLKSEPNLLKRIWKAIKYVLGYKSRYGHFDEFIFKPEDYTKLGKTYMYLRRVYNHYEAKKNKNGS